MEKVLDEPRKLAYLDTTTLQVTWLDRKSTINGIRKALTRPTRLSYSYTCYCSHHLLAQVDLLAQVVVGLGEYSFFFLGIRGKTLA
jgi:hypothetical protein